MNKDYILRLADHMEVQDQDSYWQDTWLAMNMGGDEDGNQAHSPYMTNEQLEVARPKTSTRTDYFGNKNVTKVHPITVKEGSCGTSACVLGHAVAALPETGLFFGIDDVDSRIIKNGKRVGVRVFMRGSKGEGFISDFEAGAKALSIPADHAEVMFGSSMDYQTQEFYGVYGSNELTPTVVAATLREYVKSNGQSMDDAMSRFDDSNIDDD